MMHKSLATIDSPEFINLQPLEINPLMSKCEIKVLYLGENRNHSYITKEVAADMAKTLRGAPIVGYFKKEEDDFRDHGERVILDDEGIKFECLTKPYGFVSPDAQVWFQKFEDTDEFGNVETREYLMTTGYLWTGQFEEAELAIKEGRPQSMELDSETLDGHWSTNSKTGMDFFIINDAIFSKLCILGEDVEPCFEGASVTAPQVSTSFTKIDDDFKQTLYTMMQDLKFALEGGKDMEMEENLVVEETIETPATEEVAVEEVVAEDNTETETPAVEEPVTEFDSLKRAEEVETETQAIEEKVVETDIQVEEEVATEESVVEENLTNDDNSEQSISTETQDSIEVTQSSQENFAKSDDEDEEDSEEDSESEEDDKEYKCGGDSQENKNKKKKSYSLLETELAEVKAAYSELETKYQALVEFKETVDNEKKDALIESFYMLSDEDKAEVIKNKANYSLEDIEAKLSVICVRKKVNFDLDDTSKNDNIVEEKEVMTYNISNNESTSIPAWISALKNTRDNRK